VDREQIERSDFPSARRGYDREAVDAHLRQVADEVTRRPPGSVAEGASTQVRTILEAAEAGARELRDEAGRDATAHVTRVGESANDLLAKLERLHGELDRLFAGLTDTAASLSSALERLSRDVGTLGTPAQADAMTRAAAESEPAPAAPPTDGARSRDEAGARLVALNMALEGAPRADTARFLAEHYELADLDALLDDVYASAGR
jgi:DivIVA domain-containing protein